MARYMLLALNGPREGEGNEAIYNRWYDKVHIPDLLAIKGVTSARRYKTVVKNRAEWPYVAAYEIETDDIGDFMKELGSKDFGFPAEMDRDTSAMIVAVEIAPEG